MDTSIENYIKSLVRDAIGEIQLQSERKVYVIANWKMNKDLRETAEFFRDLNGSKDVSVVICPPAPLLHPAQLLIKQHRESFSLGAQNVHWAENGAYTGEISAAMLKDSGCEYVIIGHSERRQYSGEHDEMIHMKIRQSLNNGLIPILCIGETLEEKNHLQTEQVLAAQLKGALKDLHPSTILIAYEPVWAIGTGQSATAELVQQTHEFIRSVIYKILGLQSENIPILYGGSVNEANASEYSRMPDIDGVLVGGASLKVKLFNEIINVFAKGVNQ